MSAIEPLSHWMGINLKNLSREEFIVLEAELFIRLCEELKEFFKIQYKDYFFLMKFNKEKENRMIENNLARYIARDLLSTKEYDLAGIAYYADTPEEVIQEVMDGRNIRPSATLLYRIIELHRSIRRDLYDEIIKKIVDQYLVVA